MSVTSPLHYSTAQCRQELETLLKGKSRDYIWGFKSGFYTTVPTFHPETDLHSPDASGFVSLCKLVTCTMKLYQDVLDEPTASVTSTSNMYKAGYKDGETSARLIYSVLVKYINDTRIAGTPTPWVANTDMRVRIDTMLDERVKKLEEAEKAKTKAPVAPAPVKA